MRFKRLWNIIKVTKTDKICIYFLIFNIICAGALCYIEPNIKTFGEGVWYCFSIITTIGFGDIEAVTSLGRLISIVLGIYAIFIVALVPGVVVSYFNEFMKQKENETMLTFMEQLENLPSLSKDELEQISNKVKEFKYKIKE